MVVVMVVVTVAVVVADVLPMTMMTFYVFVSIVLLATLTVTVIPYSSCQWLLCFDLESYIWLELGFVASKSNVRLNGAVLVPFAVVIGNAFLYALTVCSLEARETWGTLVAPLFSSAP